MNSRERFEAWVLSSNRMELSGMWEAWKAAERQALERAAQKFEDCGDPYGASMVRALQDAQSGEEKSRG